MSKEASVSSLVMVGTVHRDPKGFGKLLRILEREAPDFITVEISPYALEFRRKQAPNFRAILRENLKRIQREDGGSYSRLLAHGEIQGIFLLLKIPFEWRAAEHFANKRKTGLRAIDLSAFSEEKLARVSELIHPDNLRALLRTPQPPLESQVERQYKRARSLWEANEVGGLTISDEVEERERHLAGEIRGLRERMDNRKILHVGGWEHLVPDSRGKSLFEKLADLKPRRILMKDEE